MISVSALLVRAAACTAGLLVACAANATLPIQHWQTSGGARVLFVETHDLPMFDVVVDFPAGISRDVPAKSGAASLTLDLMRSGAAQLSEAQIAEQLANIGADLSGRFDMDRAGYGLRSLSSPRERTEALDILAAVLQKPTFPTPIFEREQQRTLAALKEAETRPEVIADRAFRQLVYGAHPYSL
ncbi:MAG: insulinase family protein, partial [Betaproteobacteria bacterium]